MINNYPIKPIQSIIIFLLFLNSCTNNQGAKTSTTENTVNDTLEKKEVESGESNYTNEIKVDSSDPQSISEGQAIYQINCKACHGPNGEGGVGSSLTDDVWLYGGDEKSLIKSVVYGIPDKGMIGWKDQLTPDQVGDLVSYLKSL